jgi:hypothetical protein
MNDYKSDCVVTSNYWTTLEYDECNVLHGVCWHDIKSLQHVEVWKDGEIHEKSTPKKIF